MAGRMRVEVRPELLRWALGRAGLEAEALAKRFPQLRLWEQEEGRPTFKQLQAFAKATHTPLGYFFLPTPPAEELPIPDFRTFRDELITRPSSDLLETIYICQQRQDWYREFMQSSGEDPIGFVGSVNERSSVTAVADSIRTTLDFGIEERRQCPTWIEALRSFIHRAEAAGILVMVNSVVGNNTHRNLNPEEFRGFALIDEFAPLVFINGADTKAAQMFTLAHEIAHIWIGTSALSDAALNRRSSHATERWCNQVAAEFLVPLANIREEYRPDADLRSEFNRLARRLKVSTLVVLRRIYDAEAISRETFREAYQDELQRLQQQQQREAEGEGHPTFYPTAALRASHRFARALVASTLEGKTLYRDAFRMLGVSKLSTFQELGRTLRAA